MASTSGFWRPKVTSCVRLFWVRGEAVKTLQEDIKEGLAYAENAELAGRK